MADKNSYRHVVLTKDGSPTLKDPNTNELMHNFHSAFHESLFIYLEALKKIPAKKFPSIISVGLGLAYNEIISIAYLEQRGVTHFKITSYEKDKMLQGAIKYWCINQNLENNKNKNASLFSCYATILKLCAQRFHLKEKVLLKKIKDAIETGKWIFHEEINDKTKFNEKYNCIFYDAFSEKTTPDLWKENHLKKFVQQTCDNFCIFSTYASKGVLKRVLKDEGFILEKRNGFGRKKESTLAIRT